MESGSDLKSYDPDELMVKRTDLLVQVLLNFDDSAQSTSNPGRVGRLDISQVEDSLRRLSLTHSYNHHDADDQVERFAIDQNLSKLIRSRIFRIKLSKHDDDTNDISNDINSKNIPEDPNGSVSIRSWTMTEHVYRKDHCPFPTMARGLFTHQNFRPDLGLGRGRHRIVARGYDKFFNIDEVPSTKWDTLEKTTKAPYHLTLKANGCIIFIAAISPTELIVTSKNAVIESDQNTGGKTTALHSQMGERWLNRHLSSVGLKRTELAKELWEANVTAVAELTDDDFEEHVVRTPTSEVGLNLHGINLNTPELLTYPPQVVAKCAERWGLHPIRFKSFDTIEEVRQQCSLIEKNGWDDREGSVEGIVVRGTPIDVEPSINIFKDPSASIFWKVKFEEPYLLYREWRELTKTALNVVDTVGPDWRSKFESTLNTSKRVGSSADLLSRAKFFKINLQKHQSSETRLYVHWLIQEILERPQTFEQWKDNRGIIRARESFLDWRSSVAADEILNKQANVMTHPNHLGSKEAAPQIASQSFDKTVLVPIGIPGCGKTTLAVALSKLLRCDHTQSDNITTRKTGPAFIENVKSLILNRVGPKLIIADKNNHLKTHREALTNLSREIRNGIQFGKSRDCREIRRLNVRLVALVWDIKSFPKAQLLQVSSDRIMKRGNNHQSLRPEITENGFRTHESILMKFLRDFQGFDKALNREDMGFNEVIKLNFLGTVETNLKIMIDRLLKICPEEFNDIKLDEKSIKNCVVEALNYKVELKKEMKVDNKKKMVRFRYFAVQPELDLRSKINQIFSSIAKDGTVMNLDLLNQLNSLNRFTFVPHITLLHTNQVEESSGDELKKSWQFYEQVVSNSGKSYGDRESLIRLEFGPNLVWNQRVMVVEARVVDGTEGEQIRRALGKPLHMTIGTIDESIRPIEGKLLLENFLCKKKEGNEKFDLKENDIHQICIEKFYCFGSIKGFE
ncbi:RNA ligase-domain-containing protein [Phakopsora pachyrhizi]|uniref:RNA ligase-domain-containing protein n=1 Tax=Phakopsora pachyrhizi TaxID=170000 RepID=A0AAV0B766_PHAPC|nr:RNA ligase-domain-containing protein [Phakopsora pachyrhizi]CAH7682142.1 RNA ligase-domain-containing protein [Phakopsora pachyrhizi]